MGKMVDGSIYSEIEKREGGESMGTTYEEKAVGKPVALEDDERAEVSGKLGLTISLGSYEFLRVDAGVTLPCKKSQIKQAYQEAFDMAGEELFKRVEEAKRSIV